MKRTFDFLTSLMLIIFLSPLFLVIGISIKCSSKGPIFFKQTRIGLHGNPFTLFKFRSMIERKYSDSSITLKNDIRVTQLGFFLRKLKLDELPQFWNVLKGDMSLVGPRPDIPGFADKLEGFEKKVLSMRPGITGPASLKYAREDELLAHADNPEAYNREVIFPDKVRINLDYYKNQSIALDIKIILKSIFLIANT